MKKGTQVSWNVGGAPGGAANSGRGITISEEDDTGHVAVAVETMCGEPNPGYHPLIWCAVTWLTVVALPAATAAPEATT